MWRSIAYFDFAFNLFSHFFSVKYLAQPRTSIFEMAKVTILTPSDAQIEQLRAQFFDRLAKEDAPCEGEATLLCVCVFLFGHW